MKREKLTVFLENPLVKLIQQNYRTFWLFLLGIHGLMFCASFFFQMHSLFLMGILTLMTFFLYLFLKDGTNEKQRRFGTRVFKCSLVLLTINLSNYTVLSSLKTLILAGYLKQSLVTMIFFCLDIILIIASIALYRNERVKESFLKLEEKSIFENLLGEEIRPGDTVIGIDQDTQKPVRVPLDDRYVHFLLLGPTGSGKTALSLTPMVWRDMQCPDIGITVIEPYEYLMNRRHSILKTKVIAAIIG